MKCEFSDTFKYVHKNSQDYTIIKITNKYVLSANTYLFKINYFFMALIV